MTGMSGSERQAALEKILIPARIIPVLTIARVEDGVPLARALVAGGVKTLEITFRTDAAADAARAIIAEVPEAVVGIGTVLSADDLRRAQIIGARFAVSPGATPELLDAAAASDLPLLPGVATASELMQARARGFDLLKFFPAEQSGGIPMLRALAGPFPSTRFCPTGGVSAANAATWLAEPNVIAVGGSWLCPASDVKAGNWEVITGRCIDAMKSLRRR
ncbi:MULTISPECIES: bifunctional 4-hydroxy-2-oxoglutarate aldolase/2-dehydro-3-deoxy-phosphogluconate aldolase [unclassified Afipia]|jgi:2-dehydro-3-deoxyphosphogluconate aldolase/(4S)-4-hydroxy-2-oxoglutarate aldolase|uniref:bifunctional 4-hydroxy-2-oxoglutarate aldolase/2-dehydro-3-deoxy-phosphogluconate aldolase n=1 Tax=unclassified Afipia TaxID=2642050 RepID=UPI000415F151|nr:MULTISPECIES: bifunctional 4-hydroxy-2-oxoglutarate aldolase/2-dehydro-3-deoxy-phosphogluconate aldolase [unclassified Afipia]WIG51688.1 MAG: 4-hydroxy-2-oxoglutarate aldolase/2-dehydro-3-deoxyphosphogluconate aldolase [Afipia sp.]